MTSAYPRRVAGTAAVVLALGAAGWVGASIGDGQRPATSLTSTTSSPTTTTVRSATTTTTRAAVTTTTTVVLPEVEDIPPPVVVRESPPVTPWDSGYEPWDYEPAPCQPSTFGSCDPEEPMELPVIGCDYLERDFSGNVKCVD